jgi:RNA polymerase sigma-70 factor (ECF subfamily)
LAGYSERQILPVEQIFPIVPKMRGGFAAFPRLGEKRQTTMKQQTPPDPDNLLSLARAGDSPALGQLLELYRNYLTLLARMQIGRRLQGKVDASDLIQETFLAAHRDFAGCRAATEKELVSWLRTILAANLTDLVRRYRGAKCRDVRLERQLADELDESSRALNLEAIARQSSPSAQAVRREQAVLLADALQSLPADYREVIVLRHLEGLSFLEVARRMDRSVDAVEKLWVRALARLRRILGVPL